MSDAVVIKTHEHIKRITETDISQASAEAIVNMATDVFTQQNLATKGDIEGLQKDVAGLQKEMTGVKNEITHLATKAELSDMKHTLIIWYISTTIALAAFLFAVAKGFI